jgi:protein gp37
MFNEISKGKYWDRSLTLVEGCTPVSPGCDNCWSAAMNHRFNQDKYEPENTLTYPSGKWTGQIICRPDRLDLPLKVKKPTIWAVWNDLFHEGVPFDFQLSTLVMMRDTTRHLFIILTKRPERAKYFFDLLYRGQFAGREPLFNVWLGVTAENQKQADKRIPILLQIPAAVRFVSFEPLLGEIKGHIKPPCKNNGSKTIEWAIVGCESGPHARNMNPDWARSLRDQCQVAGVPFFLKQMEIDGKIVKAPLLDGKQYLELPNV